MENVQAKPTTAVWLMISVVLVALNLRPSMAAVGPLLSSIRGEVPLSFSSAALLTMLPVMAMGLAMFFGMGLAKRFGEHRSVVLSLLVIGLATVSRLSWPTIGRCRPRHPRPHNIRQPGWNRRRLRTAP